MNVATFAGSAGYRMAASDAAETAQNGLAGQVPYKRGMTLREIMEAEETPLDIDIAEDMEREFSPQRKDTTMANMTSGAIGSATGYNQQTTAARPSTADMLESAVSALSNAASELTGIADRLCGSQPETPGSQLRGVADGHFAQIDTARGDIEAITETILSSTSRIRGRL